MSDKEQVEEEVLVENGEEEVDEIVEGEGEQIEANPVEGEGEEVKQPVQEEDDKAQEEGEGEQVEEDGEGEGDQDDPDLRSVYVKNVDYSADPASLKEHFTECGGINRVTIICNKMTGRPLGYAYIEFESTEGVDKALELMNDSLFKGRQLTVMKKRKNLPGRGRGGFRSRFPGYGRPFYPRRPFYRGYRGF